MAVASTQQPDMVPEGCIGTPMAQILAHMSSHCAAGRSACLQGVTTPPDCQLASLLAEVCCTDHQQALPRVSTGRHFSPNSSDPAHSLPLRLCDKAP